MMVGGERNRFRLEKTMQLKNILLGTVAIVSLCTVGVYHAFFRYSSTHHSSITLSLPDGAPNQERRIADYDRVTALLDAWAPTAGFAKVGPEAVGSMRQSWFSSASNGDEKILYYTEHSPKDRSFPIEIMMSFDPDGSPSNVEISTAEGYHRKPTAKLQSVHADLQKLLSENFPDQVKCGIW
jgi:hypothetical protein